MEIKITNPYFEQTYETKDFDLERWKNFMENVTYGNEEIIFFTDELTGKLVTINPLNLATSEASEED